MQENDDAPGKVYLPGAEVDAECDDVRPSKLVCDESAYVMLHKAHTGRFLHLKLRLSFLPLSFSNRYA